MNAMLYECGGPGATRKWVLFSHHVVLCMGIRHSGLPVKCSTLKSEVHYDYFQTVKKKHKNSKLTPREFLYS